MYLYLVRHGEALPVDTGDSARALTQDGIAGVERIASHLKAVNAAPDLIIHSTKARAKQTAGIMAARLRPPKGVRESSDLAPLSDPIIWANQLNEMSDNVMLVGHMPYMSKMSSLLACGLGDESAFSFDTATVVCLRRDYGRWSLLWMLSPSVIHGV